MPANARSARITDIYRQRLFALRERASALARWTVRVDDIDGTGQTWAARSAIQIQAVQTTGVALTVGYLAAFVASETGQPPAPPAVDETTVGQAQDGQPLLPALVAALITVKTALKDGREPGQAMRLGQQRAARLVGEAAVHPARVTLHEAMEASSDQITGWRRVTQGATSCGACMASADGRVRSAGERLRIHPFCDCTAEPVVAGVAETFHRPTGRETFDGMSFEQQAALLGEEKAALIRSGTVPFERLIQPQPMAIAPDGITERPLVGLTGNQ